MMTPHTSTVSVHSMSVLMIPCYGVVCDTGCIPTLKLVFLGNHCNPDQDKAVIEG